MHELDGNFNSVIEELEISGGESDTVVRLLEEWRAPDRVALWSSDARPYAVFARRLIDADLLAQAIHLLEDGLKDHPAELTLQFLHALALARHGSHKDARSTVETLVTKVRENLRVESEILCLGGRLEKDAATESESGVSREDAKKSVELYAQGFRIWQTPHAAVNVATMAVVAGMEESFVAKWAGKALKLAERRLSTESSVKSGTDSSGSRQESAHWLHATRGEALLLLGRGSEAHEAYQVAEKLTRSRFGDRTTMRRNVLFLLDSGRPVADILDLLRPGNVIVFSGHMLDHPKADIHRFPSDSRLERSVATSIGEALAGLQGRIGYSSAACGSDILFAETLLENGGELHVVLPFAAEDFVTTSVDFGYDEFVEWKERYDRVLERATEIHSATEDPYLGDSVLFEFVNDFTQGLAIAHAERLRTECCGLVVMDRHASRRIGGTRYFFDAWKEAGRRIDVIDLTELRSTIDNLQTGIAVGGEEPARRLQESERKRNVRTMLFSDLKGFSKLGQSEVEVFYEYVERIGRLTAKHKPKITNTWGDGLCVIFEKVEEAAPFALDLVDLIRQLDQERFEGKGKLQIRVAIHAGPVYEGHDPVQGRPTLFGHHVNLAARIEPVTYPGCVYVTEQIAALLATSAKDRKRFTCEYVGRVELPKAAGKLPVYRLDKGRSIQKT